MKPSFGVCFLVLNMSFLMSFAQKAAEPGSLVAPKIDRDLLIDGMLNEAEWSKAPLATGFWQNYPGDTSRAQGATEVRVLYNDRYLYISAKVFNVKSVRQYVASSLRRDFPFLENDALGVVLDTYGDHINGYGFYVSALGIQREEQVYSGSVTDATWEVKWFSAVQRNADSWTVEMAIPFRYLRFKQNLSTWNINFLRNDVGNNERSSWMPISKNFTFPNLSFAGKLEFSEKLPKSADNISFIPSLTVNNSQDRHDPVKTTVKPSLDSKIAVSSSLNLDLTVNPDFSESDADQVQVNLTRFGLSYPETRLFFIENSDLFSEFGVTKQGSGTIHPFYSRSIGLKYVQATGQYEQTPIIAGARLSGKLTKDLRIGVMTIQTKASADSSTANSRYPGQNYSVVALQQKVFSNSNIGLILTNRQAFGPDSIKEMLRGGKYNRLAGLEYNLISRNSEWTGKLFEEVMFSPGKTVSSQGGWLNFNTRRTYSWIGVTKADRDFAPDIGFVPRNDYFNPFTEINYIFYPASRTINYLAPVVHYDMYLDSAWHRTDHQFRMGLEINFKNTGDMQVVFFNDYTRLSQPFNPAINTGIALPANSEYNYSSMVFYYLSDLRQKLAGQIELQAGRYFNGNFAELKGFLIRKIQPWGWVGINYDLSWITLPKPYSANNIYAVGPQAKISFSSKLFFDSNIQYTSVDNNVNLFFRLKWRFRPLSDLYMVYGKNQNTKPWQQQNQGFILKLTYFL